ncbi:MAG TPA: hypothetical protein VFE33_34375 [Thermoanaerobaculia bacterium]|nr:hypothetical protein [Thermoanaerobaculia bacterium]
MIYIERIFRGGFRDDHNASDPPVAIGDQPNPAGAKKLVPFLLAKLGR